MAMRCHPRTDSFSLPALLAALLAVTAFDNEPRAHHWFVFDLD
jgi:hypothetical protein